MAITCNRIIWFLYGAEVAILTDLATTHHGNDADNKENVEWKRRIMVVCMARRLQKMDMRYARTEVVWYVAKVTGSNRVIATTNFPIVH